MSKEPSKNRSGSAGKITLIVLGCILLGLFLGVGISCLVAGTTPAGLFSRSTTAREEESLTWSRSSDTETTGESTTASTTSRSRSALVYPSRSQYTEEYPAEIWTEKLDYGDIINVRYGPSKTDYNVAFQVTNGTMATAFTESVNGWVFLEVNGKKGWVRSDLVLHGGGEYAKPVLYLYPEQKTDVTVKLKLKNSKFSCTYPDYNKGWKVTAYPNGTLINQADKKEYSYLYWELSGNMQFDFSKGFLVAGKDTAAFLQKTLSQMGLTPKEYNEFIVYWLPRMQNNPYNLISFQTKAYTDNVKLDISPKPDSVLRVAMAYKPLDKPVNVKPQTFPTFERKGFTVVEWGGEEVR